MRFSFYIDLEGPSADVCSYNDIELVSKNLLAFIELLLNTYLTRNGLPGMITDNRIYSLSQDAHFMLRVLLAPSVLLIAFG